MKLVFFNHIRDFGDHGQDGERSGVTKKAAGAAEEWKIGKTGGAEVETVDAG